MSLDIEQILKKLPTMSKEVESLLDALKQDFVDPKTLETKLVACPVISGRVLQIANSSFYGLCREISSLREATIILGQHTLKGLVYSLAAMDEFKEGKQSESQALLDYKLIWQHSLYSACLARAIAEDKKLNASDIFTAALFQHFGILVLESIESEKIHDAINASLNNNQSFKHTIEERVALNYVTLSAKALNYWHFPLSVCELIHSVEGGAEAPNRSIETNIVLFSNFISSAFTQTPLSKGSYSVDKKILKVVETRGNLLKLLEEADHLYSQLASDFIG